VVGEENAFRQQSKEAHGGGDDHQAEGKRRLQPKGTRDLIALKQEQQQRADGGCNRANRQIQTRATADGLVHPAGIAGGDVLRHIPNARGGNPEGQQGDMAGQRGDESPGAITVLAKRLDGEWCDEIHRHNRDHD